jgi:DNA-binding NarL/FixJ family response regulator
MIKVAIVDDHNLLRNALKAWLETYHIYSVFDVGNGEQMIEQINKGIIPDIILMDINMAIMDGFESTSWLKKNHPDIKVLVLSEREDEISIIRMFRSGAKGYLLKNSPENITIPLNEVLEKDYYISENVNGRLIKIATRDETDNLSPREIEFLKLNCSEMTLKEIASHMNVSPRTVDGYRDSLLLKLNLKSRVGLALYALKYGFVKL